MAKKFRPQITDPLEAAKVAQFEVPDGDEEEEDPMDAAVIETSAAPAMPLPAPSKRAPRYRVTADTKVFRGSSSIVVRKDKIVSAEDGADLMELLLASKVPMELID